MFDYSNPEQYTEKELIDWLKRQDTLYENEGESDVDDSVYDSVRRFAELTFSANVYFTGVGADVRGGKVKLPFNMSGLVQIHEGELEGWHSNCERDFVVSDKLDGTSAQVIYDANGELQIAYSRGNGTEGADITRHIKQIPNIPKKLNQAPGRTFPVRMEIIIPKSEWNNVQSNFTRRTGEQYKNARNATAGIMNASNNDPNVYQYLRGVAYTVIESDLNKTDDLHLLAEMGFEVVRYGNHKGLNLDEITLTQLLNNTRLTSDYELDGVVVSLNDRSRDMNGKPLDIKYKVADASNYATPTVKSITWTPSKDGYLKPVINIHPIDLCGVTVSKCTGFNAKFIRDNNIQPGSVIKITRSGDVIPFCMDVVKVGPYTGADYDKLLDKELSHFGDWQWSENKVDAILADPTANRDVALNLLTDIFSKLQIAHLRKGNLEKLYDAGYETFVDILNLDHMTLYMTLGENGAKIHESFEERLNGIYWPEFVGSLNLFGRGIGRKKLTSLYNALEGDIDKMRDVNIISAIEGFDDRTAQPIANKVDSVLATLGLIDNDCLVIKEYDPGQGPIGEKMLGQSVVFTGVRDADTEKTIVEQGGIIASGVSKKTTIVCAKDPNSASGKLKKARKINQDAIMEGLDAPIKIVDIKELQKMLL